MKPGDELDRKENIGNNESELPKEEEYSFDSSASSYSMSGSEIPENKTYINDQSANGEFEVSYDSGSGTYSRREYREGGGVPPLTLDNSSEKSGIRKSLMLLLSCAFISVIAGILTTTVLFAFFLGGSYIRGNVTFDDANVKINYAEPQESAVIVAAGIANKTVVAVNTISSGNKASSGSGVIWSANGYIVTCHHVVEGATTIVVTLSDGQRFEAIIVGSDPQTDLAVIKINAENLPSTTARGTELILGETVVAIGNPLGALSNTVTDGIISSLERQITVGNQTMTLIQTNAAVNHGNSGGGLFDSNGSLVGIVNAKAADDSVEGIGFAIPISTVLSVTTDLIEKGYVSGRAYFGFEGVFITASNYNSYPELRDFAISGNWIKRVNEGFYITDVSKVNGYAEGSSELKFGDKIQRVGDKNITSQSDLSSALAAYDPGDIVELTVVRNHNTTLIIRLILAGS